MKTQKEIFDTISTAIINILPAGEHFKTAVLEIKRLTANVGYTGYFFNSNDEKKWLDIFSLKLPINNIEELYKITQTEFPIHTNWNRAKFTLFPEGKFEIEYIWDQELQDEVDRLNK